MLSLPAISLLVAVLLVIGVDSSEDGEPEHVQQEQVLRVAFVGQQEDTHTLPTGEPSPIQPNSDRFLSAEPAPRQPHTTLLPPGVTGRPTVVEYRFGNANNQSSSQNAESELHFKSAHRNCAITIWGVFAVLTVATLT